MIIVSHSGVSSRLQTLPGLGLLSIWRNPSLCLSEENKFQENRTKGARQIFSGFPFDFIAQLIVLWPWQRRRPAPLCSVFSLSENQRGRWAWLWGLWGLGRGEYAGDKHECWHDRSYPSCSEASGLFKMKCESGHVTSWPIWQLQSKVSPCYLCLTSKCFPHNYISSF